MSRVLVVDDDKEIVDFLALALEEEGYAVQTTVGEAALARAHDLQPDVILLDINMPGMDGVEVSRRLRSDPATATIPIIVMSAQDRLQDTFGRMLANDQLPKPFDLGQLYATVVRWTKAA